MVLNNPRYQLHLIKMTDNKNKNSFVILNHRTYLNHLKLQQINTVTITNNTLPLILPTIYTI